MNESVPFECSGQASQGGLLHLRLRCLGLQLTTVTFPHVSWQRLHKFGLSWLSSFVPRCQSLRVRGSFRRRRRRRRRRRLMIKIFSNRKIKKNQQNFSFTEKPFFKMTLHKFFDTSLWPPFCPSRLPAASCQRPAAAD